jgi:outer membrane protein assembly factor BamB
MLALITVGLMLPALSRVAAEPNNSSGNDYAGLSQDDQKEAKRKPGDLLWQSRVHPSAFEGIAKKVVVAGTGVFTAGWVENVDTGFDWLVRAHDAKTGTLLWQDLFDSDGQDDLPADIAVEKSRVFVVGNANSHSWFVRAYDEKTGSILWQDELNRGHGFNTASAVVTSGQQVFVAGAVAEHNFKINLLVRAYDAETGTLLWEKSQEPPTGFIGLIVAFTNPMAIDGETIFLAGLALDAGFASDLIVWSFDTHTGELSWQDHVVDPGDSDGPFTLVAIHGKVFVSGNVGNWGVVRSYDAESGSLLWQQRGDEGGFPFLGADSGYVVVASETCSSDCDLTVRTYDAHSGGILWVDHPIRLDDQFGSNVMIKDRTVFVLSDDQPAGDIDLARLLIRTYDISSGQLRWERRVDGSPWSSAVKGDQLFISGWGTHPGTGHIDYTLRAFRIDGEDGDERNQR